MTLDTDEIPCFGELVVDADYVVRRGGYALILNDHDELAVVRVPEGCFLPGGGCEGGESEEEAVHREVLEECGVRIQILSRIGIADQLVHSLEAGLYFRKRCTFFRAKVVKSDLSGGEDETVWLPVDRALAVLRHESQRWAVEKV